MIEFLGLEQFSASMLALLFLVALVASFVDAIAGGGGLLALPALLYAGLPPLQALATNKFQGSFGTFAATVNFWRNGHIDLRKMAPAMALTFAGSAVGTIAVQSFSPDYLKLIIPFLIFGFAIFFALQPKLGEEDRHHRIGLWGFAVLFGFSIGFYDGFFGPGAGAFFTLAFVVMLGFNLVRATANTKLLNFTSNITSLGFFIAAGYVVWPIGLLMALGQFIGGYLGAHMTIRHGTKLIRPFIITVSLLMTAKLLFDNAITIATP